MDYALWEILSPELSKIRSEIKTIEDLQGALTRASKGIPLKTISGWRRGFKIVQDVEGEHFEHLL